jgi:hypothetical protein
MAISLLRLSDSPWMDSSANSSQFQRLDSVLRGLSDCLVDLSRFDKGHEIGVSGTGLASLCLQYDDGLQTIVMLFGAFDRKESCEIEKEIEKLMNITHSCIAAHFGIVFARVSKELKIHKWHARSGSLKNVPLARPF